MNVLRVYSFDVSIGALPQLDMTMDLASLLIGIRVLFDIRVLGLGIAGTQATRWIQQQPALSEEKLLPQPKAAS